MKRHLQRIALNIRRLLNQHAKSKSGSFYLAQVIWLAEIETTAAFLGFLTTNNQPRTAPSNYVDDMHTILLVSVSV